MGLINKMKDNIRRGFRRFLRITPSPNNIITIGEGEDFLTACAKCRIWYGGRASQLSELYKQLENIPDTMFWKAPMTRGLEIRKIHTGLPALIVDTFVHIVMSDFNGIEINSEFDGTLAQRWEKITAENNLDEVFEKLLCDVGITGDGALKISFDRDISDQPIIEWFPSERVRFTYKRSRIREIVFYTDVYERGRRYQLAEIYGYGYISYKLYTDEGNEAPLTSTAKTAWAQGQDIVFDESLMWAVPVIFGRSAHREGRGKGLIESKEGAFDAFDEIFSQWMDAFRAGRTKQYIPENMIPYNPKTAQPMKPNAFDNRFIAIGNDVSENGSGNRVYTESPEIRSGDYLSAYVTALDLCLQGLISPSTLGIDVKKLDNAEAQREKEKATLYTRRKYINLLEKTLPALVLAAVNASLVMENNEPVSSGGIEIKLNFGEYANPSFESQVETVGKAKTSGTMSIEASVEELYGSSKSEEWKREEVRRIKAEQGIAEEEQPYELDDIEV